MLESCANPKGGPMTKRKKILRYTLCILLSLTFLAGLMVFGLNVAVKSATKDKILTPQEAAQLQNVDSILVLGCGVRDDFVRKIRRGE